jgi:hypothetical protein
MDAPVYRMPVVAIVSHVWLGHIPFYHRLLVETAGANGFHVLSLSPTAIGGCEVQPKAIHVDFGIRLRSPEAPDTGATLGQPAAKPNLLRILLAKNRTGRSVLAARWWCKTTRALRRAEKQYALRIDFVVIVYPASDYIDLYTASKLIPYIFPWRWVGVWNSPELRRGNGEIRHRLFLARNCLGVVVPDPILKSQLEECNDELNVIAMPEAADLRPAVGDEIAPALVRARAGKRRIVGLLGNITLRKGILTFVQMAEMAHRQGLDLFFLAAGDFSPVSCGGEYPTIAKRVSSAPPNFLLIPDRIADGPEFNSLVISCDVIFAAYHNFPYQSNILTKAAAFGKPIVVSEDSLLESHVRSYRLGAVVPQGDARKALSETIRLCTVADMISDSGMLDYARRNSPEMMDDVWIALKKTADLDVIYGSD